MDIYNTVNDFENINTFNNLYRCSGDTYSCFMGLFFPYCLFGKIYEMSDFGGCFSGCCKLFTLQFSLSSFFAMIIFLIQWKMLYSKEYDHIDKIELCGGSETNNTCSVNINYYNNDYYDNHCILKNNTDLCDCLKQPLTDYCKFTTEQVPTIKEEILAYSVLFSMIHLITISLSLGTFSGYYRNKISHRYDITYNNRYSFCIHCFPLTHPCALCQEYNTVKRMKYREYLIAPAPVVPMQTFSTRFIV